MKIKLTFELYTEIETVEDVNLCKEILTDQIAAFAKVNSDKCKVEKLDVTIGPHN